jgi:hypothetical protein
MASLEQIMAETSKSYDASRQALQKQIDAIAGRLDTTNQNINAQYGVQQQQLEANRDTAAGNASMQAAGSGGSFGGAANLANRKYYEQSFVPAQTQLQTNQAQALSEARSGSDANRLSLEAQLAGIEDEATRYALSRYDAAVEAERQEQLARAQLAAQNSYNNYLTQANAATPYWGRGAEFGLEDSGGLYFYDANGTPINAAQYAAQTGTDIRGLLTKMAQYGDKNAKFALAGLNNKAKQLTNEERSAFGTLGISLDGYGSRA